MSRSATTDASAAARAARVELERLLDVGAPSLRASLPHEFADACERYVSLLLEANARLNLTRVVEPEAVARFHLLDALAALPTLDELAPRRAIDLGTGGGVPGMVLALARPAIQWTLVDSVAKKVAAVTVFARELGIADHVGAMAQRAERLGRDPRHRERYDLVTARACAALPVLVEYGLPLLRGGGLLLAWKGPAVEGDAELRRGATASGQLGGGQPMVVEAGVAALGGHRFVTIAKVATTPRRFPRRPGEPTRKPLG